jgi:hypothetical protein
MAPDPDNPLMAVVVAIIGNRRPTQARRLYGGVGNRLIGRICGQAAIPPAHDGLSLSDGDVGTGLTGYDGRARGGRSHQVRETSNEDRSRCGRECMSNGVISVSRGRDSCGVARQIDIYLDEVRLGAVRWNQTAEFLTPPGPHVVYVKMDWCRSPSLDVNIDAGVPTELAITAPNPFVGVFAMFFRPRQFFGLTRRATTPPSA